MHRQGGDPGDLLDQADGLEKLLAVAMAARLPQLTPGPQQAPEAGQGAGGLPRIATQPDRRGACPVAG